MRFLDPFYLLFLLILIPSSILLVFNILRGNKSLYKFVHPSRWKDLLIGYSVNRLIIKLAISTVVAFFLILTMARPSWGNREQMVVDRGLDILIAMDVSRSMLAEDVSPNRLEHAKSQVRQFLAAVPGNRVGLMPFAGDAYVQIPITSDYEFLLQKLNALRTDTIQTPGTNMTKALEAAQLAFDQGAIGTKILLFITDGENHTEGLDEAIAQAAQTEITIYSIGLGSTAGSEIRINGNTLRDPETGDAVVSKLGIDTLKKMSEETGGEAYISKSGSRIDISPLIKDIQYLESIIGAEKSATRYIPEERFQFPLAIALIFLLLETLIAPAYFPKRRVVTS